MPHELQEKQITEIDALEASLRQQTLQPAAVFMQDAKVIKGVKDLIGSTVKSVLSSEPSVIERPELYQEAVKPQIQRVLANLNADMQKIIEEPTKIELELLSELRLDMLKVIEEGTGMQKRKLGEMMKKYQREIRYRSLRAQRMLGSLFTEMEKVLEASDESAPPSELTSARPLKTVAQLEGDTEAAINQIRAREKKSQAYEEFAENFASQISGQDNAYLEHIANKLNKDMEKALQKQERKEALEREKALAKFLSTLDFQKFLAKSPDFKQALDRYITYVDTNREVFLNKAAHLDVFQQIDNVRTSFHNAATEEFQKAVPWSFTTPPDFMTLRNYIRDYRWNLLQIP